MRFFHFFRSYCNYFRKRLYIFLKSAYFKTEIEKSLTVQNILICLVINANEIITSRNIMKYFRDIGKKLLELSEFHFTVLPTFEYSLLQENEKRTNIFRVLFILVTHLISSIPEWPEIFFRIEEKTRKFSNYRCIYSIHINTSYFNAPNFRLKKCLIILFILTRLDLQTPICYNLHARFLIDNSIEMALKDFSYVETNLVQNFKSII